ncbi:MAG TPA: L,D-transpeptidase [Candidatus Limnocylindrales bacterium]|nr:L,D-transpeptidase [Candidatus Limnocylindrales bacterium]
MSRPVTAANHKQTAFALTSCSLVLAAMVLGAANAAAQTSAPIERKPAVQPVRRIVVSIPDHKLALLEDDLVVRVYAIAVGAPTSPSPVGEFFVAQRVENPGYYHPGVIVPPGKGNPLGTRWVGLNVKGVGIHGTNRPDSIGKNASHGCIRLRNRDIEDLFARVKVGDRVSLVGERTEEVARLFGTTPDSAHASETLVARNESGATQDNDSIGER